MINVNDFKIGITILLDGNLFQILEFLHVKPGKGGAFVRTKLKNLKTKSIIDYTFNAGIKVERALVTKKQMQYLYNTEEEYVFMDKDTYEQISLTKDKVKDVLKYLKENGEVEVVSYDNEIIALNLPEKIELIVNDTEPAIKGNTVSNATKDAVLETGLSLRVPLFIEQGDIVIISTKDGKYISRK